MAQRSQQFLLNAGDSSTRTVQESLGSKLRRLAAKARTNNVLPQYNAPWLTEAAWAANTTYTTGQIVSNGVQLYICATAGASAAAGGPAGTGLALINDNAAQWFWYGPPITAAALANAPVVTVTNNTAFGFGVETVYNGTGWGSVPGQGQKVALLGGQWANIAAASPIINGGAGSAPAGAPNAVTVPTPAGPWFAYNGMTLRIAMLTDSQKFGFGFLTSGGGQVRVAVEDNNGYLRYVRASGLQTTGAGNTTTRVTVDLTGLPAPRPQRMRLVVAECVGYVSNHYSMCLNSAYDMAIPLARNQFVRAVFFVDSYGGQGLVPGEDYASRIGRLLGWDDVWSVGVSGTGFLNPNNINTAFNYLQKAQAGDATGFCPDADVICLHGSLNDGTPANYPAVTQAALQTLQTLRAQAPGVPIFFSGNPNYPLNTGGRNALIDAAYQQAVNQLGDPLTFYFSEVNDMAGPWNSGTGTVAAPTGNGNNDFYYMADATHPTPVCGQQYLTERIADKIRQCLQVIP